MSRIIDIHRRRDRVLALALVTGAAAAAALTAADCGGSADARAAARAACFPPCVASLVERCPLTGSCRAGYESAGSVAAPGESQGIATCFASGERERQASDALNRDVIYVKASDGSECYEAVGGTTTSQGFDVSVSERLVATISRDVQSGTITVTCDGATTTVDPSKPDCQLLPWENVVGCKQVHDCTFGAEPATPVVSDAGAPADCDPGQCTTPPANYCVNDAPGQPPTASQYGAGACDVSGGCAYPLTSVPCSHGCYRGTCTGPLATLDDITAAVKGTAAAVSLIGGGTAPAGQAVTVKARTSPRGSAASVSVDYSTDAFASKTTVGLSPDLLTPADQNDYDQWTADLPAQPAGASVMLYLSATGYDDSVSISSSGPSGDASSSLGYTVN